MIYLEVDPWDLCTALRECVVVRLGPVDDKVLQVLRDERYDQAPVLHADGRVLGIVSTEEIERLSSARQSLREDNPSIKCRTAEWYGDRSAWVPGNGVTYDGIVESEGCDLRDLLAVFEVRTSVLVASSARLLGDDDLRFPPWMVVTGNGEKWCHQIVGLITLADLNKAQLRSAIYTLFCAFEDRLASLLRKEFSDPWEWIARLPEGDQVQIVGSWELRKRRRVDLDPLHSCTLTHMIRIMSASRAVAVALGLRDEKELKRLTARLPDFRNRVMHPVRPLVHDSQEVTDLADTVDRLDDLIARMPTPVVVGES